MAKKIDNTEVLLDEPQDQDKKSAKKIIIDIVGIVLVIVFIIGTYLLVVFREEIIAAIPIIRDENGKIVIKKEPEKTNTRETEKLIVPQQGASDMRDSKVALYEIDNFEVDDKGLRFDLTVKPVKKRKTTDSVITIDRILIDGYEFPNRYELKMGTNESVTQEILLEKTEFDKYGIIRPNKMKMFVLDSENEKQTIPAISTINFNYNTPMDNSLKGLIPIGEQSDISFYFYKQESDIEYTYLYFDIKNASSLEKKIIRVKKLVVNDKIINVDDVEEEAYYLTEKLFYIRIPRQKIAKVNKFTISFFVIANEDKEDERIYITKEYTHEE